MHEGTLVVMRHSKYTPQLLPGPLLHLICDELVALPSATPSSQLFPFLFPILSPCPPCLHACQVCP